MCILYIYIYTSEFNMKGHIVHKMHERYKLGLRIMKGKKGVRKRPYCLDDRNPLFSDEYTASIVKNPIQSSAAPLQL